MPMTIAIIIGAILLGTELGITIYLNVRGVERERYYDWPNYKYHKEEREEKELKICDDFYDIK